MLQRSWTEACDGDEADSEAADDTQSMSPTSTAGIVYVGRASFRMETVSSTMATIIVGADAAGEGPCDARADAADPSERIILPFPASTRLRRQEATGRRRPMNWLFGAAFAVGVGCTLLGQIVLHSRERRAAHAALSSVGFVEAPARLPASGIPGDVEGPPRPLAAPPGALALASSEAPAGIDPVSSLPHHTFALPGTLGGEDGLDRKYRAHSHPRLETGAPMGRKGVHRKGAARWIDPFVVDGEAAAVPTSTDAPPGTRAAAATPGWVDPFSP